MSSASASMRPFALDLARPLSTAGGEITERRGWLVRIEYEGIAGIGEATPLPGWTESRERCGEALETAMVELWDGNLQAALSAVEGLPAASHGLRLAIADRQATVENRPLYRYLGGDDPVERVPVNATIGDAPVWETVEAAEAAVDAGFGTLKIKVGGRSVAEDVRRVRGVRDAVGPAVLLRADANGGWSREQASNAFQEFREIGVRYVEQPLPPGDLEGLATLRRHGVGVAVDETLRERTLAAVLDTDAVDTVILKPMTLGGPQRTVRAARTAREHGVDPVVTTTVDAVVARCGAVHCAAAIPGIDACGLATADRLASDLGDDPVPVERGQIAVPQETGLGAEGVWD